jgi:FAD-dependent oxidoreductase domain-containing protein 1
MNETFDVIIGGGAVMGSSTAYHLAAHPDFSGKILVLDKDLTYQGAASSLSLSSVRQQFSSTINIRVGLYGADFFRRAADVLSVDGQAPQLSFRENGYLFLASEAGEPILRENHAAQIAEGANIVLLDRAALAERFPFLDLGGVALGSLGVTGEGWFDGYALMQAFRRKARSLGAVYRQEAIVDLEREAARVTGVRLASGERIACGAFVNTAGASGAAQLVKRLGLDVPVHSRKRCVFVFTAKTRLERCPLVIDSSGVYVRPEGEAYVCGVSPPESEDPDCEDFEVVWPQFDEIIWPVLAARIPAFESIRPGRAWACHYDLNTFDHNAIVGRLPGFENALLAAGFSGHGIQQSPAVGRGLAELIVSRSYTTLDLAPFAVERIAASRPLLERNVI